MSTPKNKILASAIAAALLVGGQAAHAAGAGYSGNAIRIGVLTDMSSVYTNAVGAGAIVAAQMAIEDFGKASLGGAKIEVISADDQNSATIGQEQAKKLIEKDGADLIIGAAASSAAVGAAKETWKSKKILIVPAAASSTLTNENCSPTSFHWMYDTYGFATGLVKGLTDAGKKKWFFVTSDYSFGYTMEKDATDILVKQGGKVVGSAKAPFPGLDFTEQLKAAKESGAEVVAFAAAGLDAVGMLRQAKQMGLDEKATLAPMVLFHQDIFMMQTKELAGTNVMTSFHWNQSKEAMEFSKRFYQKTKRMPDIGQAGTYSGVLHYLKAVDAAGTDDGMIVAEKMRSMEIQDPVVGKATIRADGKVMKEQRLVQIKQTGDSKFPWDLYSPVKVFGAEEMAVPLAMSQCPLVTKKDPTPTSVMGLAATKGAAEAAPSAKK